MSARENHGGERGSDRRGRVTLRAEGRAASRVVLHAAMRLARAFRGEIRAQFLENEELLSLAHLPFAREIVAPGATGRALTPQVVEAEMATAAASMRRELARLAGQAGIGWRFERIAAQLADRAFEEMEGVLALAEPAALASPRRLARLEKEALSAPGIAGIVMAGEFSVREGGPVLAAIEPGCDVAFLVDTAEALAREAGEGVVLAIGGERPGEILQLRQAALGALDKGTRAQIVEGPPFTAAGFARIARVRRASLALAGAGGNIAASGAVRLACALDCPLLLLRG
jgi:hypothetical protein